MTQPPQAHAAAGGWELEGDDFRPPPDLRAYVIPPAAMGVAGRTGLPALFDAHGQQVWVPGWSRWGVLYARWRLRDGRWLQARRKVSQGAHARTNLTVTATELATDDRQARWFAPEHFPATELLGPLPEEDPAWAVLLSALASLDTIDALSRRLTTQGVT